MKNRHICIAYLMSGIFYGGAAKSLSLLIKSIKNFHYERYIFSYNCKAKAPDLEKDFINNSEHLEKIKINQISNNQHIHTSYIKFLFTSNKKVKKFAKKLINYDIDILHINTTCYPHLHKWIKRYNKNIKIITHVRELIPKHGNGKVQKYMINNINKYSDAIIAISDNEAKPFLEHQNIHILSNPFDFSELKLVKNTFRKDNSIPNSVIVVGMMGNFSRAKGHFIFLKALKNIVKSNINKSNILFVIIGVKSKTVFWKYIIKRMLLIEDYRKVIQRFIIKNNLENHIKLIPYTKKVLEIIKCIDIIVRPSLSGDPWGRDIIESMAMSKPVIATGTFEYYIENGKTGYLVPAGEAEKLADKILELINDPKKRETFGKRGYEKVERMCNLNEYGEQINKIYQDLMSN